MALPNRGPFDPMYANLPPPEDGMVHSQVPFDQKFLNDPEFYDTLGRSLIEQRGILTKGYSDEEQVAMIKEILDEHPTEFNGDGREWLACLMAAMKGSAAVMRYVVRERGVHVDNAPKSVGTLDVEMMHAAINGYIEVAEVLVDEAGMTINVVQKGGTPLDQALLNGRVEMVKWLLDRGATCDFDNPNPTIFRCAVRGGKIELVELMLAKAMEQVPGEETKRWIKGDLIAEASAKADEELMAYLIEKGDYPLANDATPEQRALGLDAMVTSLKNDKTNQICQQWAIDRALVTDGSGNFIKTDEEEVLNSFRMAIGIACNRGKVDDLRKMLDLLFRCTNIKQDSDDFRYVLKHAIRRCYAPVARDCAIELLENWNADPNAHDTTQDWSTPLAGGAVGRGNPEWTKFWIERGADIHRAIGPYCNGPTALAQAVQFRERVNVIALLQQGGPVDRMDDVADLVGKKELLISVQGRGKEEFLENGKVELTAVPEEEEGEETPAKQPMMNTIEMVLEFENGVTEEWLKRIQLRKPATELANDGTGRPRKTHRG